MAHIDVHFYSGHFNPLFPGGILNGEHQLDSASLELGLVLDTV